MKFAKNQKAVLDIGCGNGNFSINLAKKNFYVEAIDINKETIKGLKKRIKRGNLNIKPILIDINNFKFKKNITI